MDIYRKRLLWKVMLLIFAVIIGLGSLFYTHDLVDRLKEEERKKAEQWAEATRRLVTSDDFEFLFSIIEDNTTVPVILIDEEESIISQRNLPSTMATDTLAMVRELKRMAKRNDPISIELPNGIVNQLYYRESTLLRQLRVYPYVQLAVILLFIGVAYVAFSSSRMAEQNQVWVGLSRETAHQLGTPTSSLSAWSEIISSRYPGTDIAEELPADGRQHPRHDGAYGRPRRGDGADDAREPGQHHGHALESQRGFCRPQPHDEPGRGDDDESRHGRRGPADGGEPAPDAREHQGHE